MQTEPYLIGEVEPCEEVVEEGVELDALVHHVNRFFQRMVDQSQQIPEELQVAAINTREPGRLADLLASSLPFTIEEKQSLLGEINVRARLERLGQYLSRQLAILELSTKIQEQVGSELTKAQRDHFLRQQLKAIQDELGESESENPEIGELWERIKKANPPREVQTEAERELERLAGMHPSSAEYSIVRTYLDWLAILPWSKASRDRLDLRRARKVLDADHYDLEKIKERILEYLAVRKLKKDMKGPILCLSGPPGTGKTSLGKSIAKALGREFVRVSLGGVHDEAEIRGHRRTYVAALPGRVIQGIRKAGTNNPVFMLDEVDKLGADFRGDPSAALLEVLDPEQNSTFRDHYLDVDFDLSKVMFIATANMLETIPSPLLDRLEVLQLPGYSEEEKTHDRPEIHHPQAARPARTDARATCRSPTRRSARSSPITPARPACATSSARSPRSAGSRPAAAPRASAGRRTIEPKRDRRAAGPVALLPRAGRPDRHPRRVHRAGLDPDRRRDPLHRGDRHARQGHADPDRPARRVDARKRPGRPELPAQPRQGARRSTPRGSHKTDLHIHVPAGAVPKDGPSAGVAIAAALISLFRDKPIQADLAMTGEVTLTGRVLPVGGVREKILAARRAGIKTRALAAAQRERPRRHPGRGQGRPDAPVRRHARRRRPAAVRDRRPDQEPPAGPRQEPAPRVSSAQRLPPGTGADKKAAVLDPKSPHAQVRSNSLSRSRIRIRRAGAIRRGPSRRVAPALQIRNGPVYARL